MWNCICLLWTLILNCNLYVFIAEDVSQWSVTVHMRWDANGHKTIYDQRQLSINFTCNNVWTHLSNDGIYKSSLTTQLQTIQTHKPIRRWNQLRHHRNLKLMNYQDYCIRNFPPSMLDWCGWTDSHFVWSHTDGPCYHPQHSVVGDWNRLNIVVAVEIVGGFMSYVGFNHKNVTFEITIALWQTNFGRKILHILLYDEGTFGTTETLFDIGNVLVLNIDLRHQLQFYFINLYLMTIKCDRQEANFVCLQ